MSDERAIAQHIYETVCSTLDGEGWKYDRHDEDLVITCGARGDDLPMDIVIMVNQKAQVISLFSVLPFKINEKARVDAAIAVSVANYNMVNGCFDYDISDGDIRFRMVSSYRDSLIGAELIKYMIYCSASTVDKYNDKFLMLSNGIWDIKAFLEWTQKEEN